MKFAIAFTILLATFNTEAAFPTIQKLKKTYSKADLKKMKQGKVVSSYSLINWHQWEKQPGVHIFEPSNNYRPPEDLFIFHSRSYFIVNKAPSHFQASHFLNMGFLQKVESGNSHKNYTCPNFCVITTIPFPADWTETIENIKALTGDKILSNKTVPYLEVDNEYAFFGSKDAQILKPLIPIAEQPVAMLRQNTKSINQMFQFGGSVIAIYDFNGKSLVVIDVAIGIEKDLDDKVNGDLLRQAAILSLTFRNPENLIPNILLGKDKSFNSKTGIGSGLPNYTKSVAERTKALMEKM